MFCLRLDFHDMIHFMSILDSVSYESLDPYSEKLYFDILNEAVVLMSEELDSSKYSWELVSPND